MAGAAVRVLRGAAVAAGLAVAAAAPAFAQKWAPHIDLEGKLGNDRDLGEADVFVPLWQNGTSLVFGNVKARLDDNAGREGNFGLGLRHMLESGWNLGAYGYYDRRRTETQNWFSQATFGAEALSLDWDLRANAYLALGTRIHDLGGSSGGTSAAISGTTVQITTAATQIREEKSLQGFDAEIGWRVPVFDADAGRALRLYAGAYRFYADDVDPVQGPRGRAELAFDEVPFLWAGSRLTLGGEVQRDGPRGTTGFATARLRIPLQVFGGGDPASGARLTPRERRMADPVVRDIDIVSRPRSVVVTPASTETATETSGGSAITVIDSGSTTGAALPGAITTAGASSTVILSGTFNTTATVTLQAGQTVMGSGTLTVRSASGKTATLTTASATISAATAGGTGNPAVALANNSTLSGLTISNSTTAGNGGYGVRANGVTTATISNNTISASETGGAATHAIQITGASTGITISGNTVTATGTGGNQASALSINGSGVTVTSNTLGASGGGGALDQYLNLSTANIAAGSSGNTTNGGNCTVGAAGTGQTVTFTNAAACGP